MRRFVVPAAVVLLLGVGGCAQGPGHTRALGTAVGTAAGAALGAAASPCFPAGGALFGAGLGMAAGSMIGDGIACDQERRGCNPCGGCSSCAPSSPCPPPRVVRRTVIREQGPPVGTVVSERVIRDPEPIPVVRSQAPPPQPCDFGYRGS